MVIAVNQNLFQLQTLQKPLQVFKIDPIELNKLPSPTAKPKVLSQTPAAGTAMARGSKVNLVLVNGSNHAANGKGENGGRVKGRREATVAATAGREAAAMRVLPTAEKP